jgi:hypothetical protein
MGNILKKLRLKQSTYEPRAYPNPGKVLCGELIGLRSDSAHLRSQLLLWAAASTRLRGGVQAGEDVR